MDNTQFLQYVIIVSVLVVSLLVWFAYKEIDMNEDNGNSKVVQEVTVQTE